MQEKLVRYVLPAIAVLITIGSLYNSWGTSRANNLVDEGNAASESADALVVQHGSEFQKLFSNANLEGFPGHREKYQASAQETADAFEKAAGLYRVAASKLDEASRQPVGNPNAAYFAAKAQSFRKLGDSKETYGKAVRLLLNEAITDINTLKLKVEPLIVEALAASAESDKFSTEAQQVIDTHKDDFQ